MIRFELSGELCMWWSLVLNETLTRLYFMCNTNTKLDSSVIFSPPLSLVTPLPPSLCVYCHSTTIPIIHIPLPTPSSHQFLCLVHVYTYRSNPKFGDLARMARFKAPPIVLLAAHNNALCFVIIAKYEKGLKYWTIDSVCKCIVLYIKHACAEIRLSDHNVT